jgi:hypothetical protein
MDNVQKMRLFDVFVLAPFMVYAGAVKSNLHPVVRGGLVFFGITTFVYNGTNFIKNIEK